MTASCRPFFLAVSLLTISSTSLAGSDAGTALRSITVDLRLDEVSVERTDGATAGFAGGELTCSPGEPALPRYVSLVLLPPDADLGTVKAELRNTVVDILPGTWEVAPMPADIVDGRQLWPHDAVVHNGKDVAAYSKTDYWPKLGIERRVCKQMRQWKTVQVTIAPFAYNPSTGKLRQMTEAQLVVKFSRSEKPRISSAVAPHGLDAHIRSHLQRATSNFEDMINRYNADEARSIEERRMP